MEPTIHNSQYQPPKPKNYGLWTVLGLVILIIIVGIIYFASNASLKKQGASVADISLGNQPQVLGGTATVTGLGLVTLETFPYQVNAKVALDVSDSCSTPVSNVTQAGNIYTITVTTTKPATAVCAQVITPAELTVSLPVANASAGTYTVNAGTYSKTFTFTMKNQVQYNSAK